MRLASCRAKEERPQGGRGGGTRKADTGREADEGSPRKTQRNTTVRKEIAFKGNISLKEIFMTLQSEAFVMKNTDYYLYILMEIDSLETLD